MTKTFFRLCAVALLATPLAHSVAQAPTAPAAPKAAARVASPAPNYGKLSLSFEPNRGQADPTVQFLARGSQYTVLLQPTAATLILSREDAASGIRHAGRPAPVTRAAVRMTLDGANPHAAMSPDHLLPGYVNYISGDRAQTRTGIPTYAATRAAGVYPGIDLIYYGTGRELEYDFIVSPKSDPSLIHLAIDGAHPVVESNGDLRLQIGATSRDTDIALRQPILYQEIDGKRKPVDGAYAVAANGEVGFRIGNYDRSRELVIDPVISYASYYGGGIQDNINASTLNTANQLYAVGHTYSANLPSTSGELDTSNPNNAANSGGLGFITKFSADGSTVLWSTFIGGPAAGTTANGVTVNSADQPYIVGSTTGTSMTQNGLTYTNTPLFPITSDAYQPLCGPNGNGAYGNPTTGETSFNGTNAFIIKLSSDGKSLLYGTFLGGSTDDEAIGVALDTTGNIYVTGHTNSTGYTYAVSSNFSDVPSYPVNNHGKAAFGVANFPTTASAFQSNTAESKMYTTTDGSGNIFGPADEQAFFSVLSSDGHSLLYSTLIGGGNLGNCGNGACATNVNAIAVSPQGIAYIGGNTSSSVWPITAGAFAATCSAGTNGVCAPTGWLAAFDRTKSGASSLLFSTYMTGSSGGTDSNGNNIGPFSSVNGLTTDAAGNVYATGYTLANNFPTTTNVLQTTCALGYADGNGDHNTCNSAFVTKLTSTGSTVWSTYYRGTNLGSPVVTGSGITVDASNDVYVLASSYEPSVPLKNAFNSSPNGTDALLFELAPDASKLVFGTYLGAVGGVTVTNNSLQLDSNLNAYFTGTQTFQTNGNQTFPTTPGAFSQTGFGNSTVSWVVKMVTQQQVSSTALQITPTSGAPGTSISFTATVTGLPAFATPTGTVTLTNGTTTLGTITLAKGTGVFTTSTLAAGTYNVIATYSGDAVYAASATTAQAVSIQNTPTVALTATPSTTTIGTPVALKATVTSSAGTPTGTIYFMDGANTLGSAVLVSGSASYSAAALAVGSHSITARYSGDSNFVAVNSAAQTVTINLITPTVTLTATPTTAQIGIAIALGATVTGTGTSPTGTVKFLDGTTVLNTFTLTGTSGIASYSAASLAVGTHSITAVYSGDANFASVTSAAQTVTINAIPATVSIAANPSSLTIKSGATGTTVITVTPAGGYTGTLTFSCGTLPTSASCSFSPATLVFTGGATAQTSTLTISTTSTHAMLALPLDHQLSVIAFAGLLLLPLALRRRAKLKSHLSVLPMLALAGLFATLAVTGCSSSGGSATSTPAGNYTVPVTVSGGTASNNLNLQVTVQ